MVERWQRRSSGSACGRHVEHIFNIDEVHSHFSNRGVNFVSHVVVLWERCVVLPARLPALRVAPRLGPTALVTMPCEQMRSWTDLHLALHDGRSCCVSARKRNMLAHALPHAVRHVLE